MIGIKWLSSKLLRIGIAALLLTSAVPASPGSGYAAGDAGGGEDDASVFEHFITRTDDKLMDGDNEFRFIGMSAPTAHYNEDPYKHFPSAYEIEDTVRTLKQLGSTATRIYILPVRGGNLTAPRPVYVEAPGVYNEEGFRALDKFMELSNQYGIRVIIPFTDAHKFWGGIDALAAFRGKTVTEFWTDPTLKADFKDLIAYLLNRTNVYTGVKYKDDKAVLAWQFGNELEQYRCQDGGLSCQDAWASEMAAFIKSIDDNHLVMDGRDRNFDHVLNDTNIDIVDGHYYALYDGTEDLASIAAEDRAKTKGKKALIISEAGIAPVDSIFGLFDEVAENGTAGVLLWSMRGHREAGGMINHNENSYQGISFKSYHWPGFDSSGPLEERRLLMGLRERAFALQGVEPPAIELEEPPYLHRIEDAYSITWKGVTGAAYYELERSARESGPWQLLDGNVTDEGMPPLYADKTAVPGQTYYYRVRGVSPDGHYSPYSNTVRFTPRTFVDDLDNMAWISSRTEGIILDTKDADRFEGDTSRLTRMSRSRQEAVYRAPDGAEWTAFQASAYFRDYRDGQLLFMTSSDGINYTEYKPTAAHTDGEWRRVDYYGSAFANLPMPAGTTHLKIVFPETIDTVTDVQLSRIAFTYGTRQDIDFSSLSQADAYSSGITSTAIDAADWHRYGSAKRLLTKVSDREESIVYRSPDEIGQLAADVYYPDREHEAQEVRWYAANEGGEFEPVEVIKQSIGGDPYHVVYRTEMLPAGTKRIKLEFPSGPANAAASVTRIELRGVYGHSSVLQLDTSLRKLEAGGSLTLAPAGGSAEYESSDVNVAAVSLQGVVSAGKAGAAWITVTAGGYRAIVPVLVTDDEPVITGVRLSEHAYTVGRSSTIPLMAAAEYSDGAVRNVTDEAVFETADNEIAITGPGAALKGIKLGETSVDAFYAGHRATSAVEVVRPTSFGELIDPLNNFNLIDSRSSNVKFDSANQHLLHNDGSRLRRGAITNEHIVYRTPYPIQSFEMTAYKQNETSPYEHFKFLASSDGVTYREVDAEFVNEGIQPGVTESWVKLLYRSSTLPDSARYLKIQFIHPANAPDSPSWNPQIGEVAIQYAEVERVTLSSGDVSLNAGDELDLQVQAFLTNDDTTDVTGRATYSSTHPEVASVDPLTGVLRAHSVGAAVVTASFGGAAASIRVEVAGNYTVQITALTNFAGRPLDPESARGVVRVHTTVTTNHPAAPDAKPRLMVRLSSNDGRTIAWSGHKLDSSLQEESRESGFLLSKASDDWRIEAYVIDEASDGSLLSVPVSMSQRGDHE